MANMSYCRHENTLSDLRDVWNKWYDFEPEESNEYEVNARKQLRKLILEMAAEIQDDFEDE